MSLGANDVAGSDLERLLLQQLKYLDFPVPVREYRFHPVRKWRFDMAWPDRLIAIEVEGLGGGMSRHLTIKGFSEDAVKYNTALILGWRVLRVTGRQIETGEAAEWISQLFERFG